MITQRSHRSSSTTSSTSSGLPFLSLFLAALLLPTPTTLAFLQPSVAPAPPTPADTRQQQVPPSQLSSTPLTDGSRGSTPQTRKSIFPVPLMSFYGEQRRQLQEAEEAQQMEWAKHFNELIVTQGQELCVAGYEGYLRSGSKGAVTTYCDGEQGLNACTALQYTTLEDLLADDRMEDAIKEQLVERVTSYDPDLEVAVLFAYEGRVGLNVLRPQYPPKFIFETLRGKK